MPNALRRDLARALGALVGRMHDLGFSQRDLKAPNLLVREDARGVALEVTNYDAALATVQAAGIPIAWGPNDFPPCRSFAIKDPDGNELYIHQLKARA